MESRMFFSVAQLLFQFQDISLQNTLPTTISSVAFPPQKRRFRCLVFQPPPAVSFRRVEVKGVAKSMVFIVGKLINIYIIYIASLYLLMPYVKKGTP